MTPANAWKPRHPRAALWFGLVIGAASVLLVLFSASARASAPAPAAGQCTTGTSPHGHPLFRCLNKTYHCDASTPDHAQINVVVKDSTSKVDGVHLDDGCSSKSIRVRIETDSGDGIKIHTGAEHLKVWFGKPRAFGTKVSEDGKVGILCSGKHGDVHQDGIQAMGGLDVQIMAPNIRCDSGNNGGLFCNAGKNAAQNGNAVPTDIVVHGGFVYEGNASIHVGPNSAGCGAVGVTMKTDQTKASPPDCIRVDHDADRPVNDHNVCTTPK
jgi:hypothetical protein